MRTCHLRRGAVSSAIFAASAAGLATWKQNIYADVPNKAPSLDAKHQKSNDFFPNLSFLSQWWNKIYDELSFGPGSLYSEILLESTDPCLNPEIRRRAHVRIGTELCPEEQKFLSKRTDYIRDHLGIYLGIPDEEIDERDAPVIAMALSGGGYRALLGSAGYLQAANRAGIFDITTYWAGVSGGTWLQNIYLTLGARDWNCTVEHLKSRVDRHIADPSAFLSLFTEAPTNKYLLRGIVEKFAHGSSLGLTDIYGTLLAARLMVRSNELVVDDTELKISSQSQYITDGKIPMPIYTCVRHQIVENDNKAETPGKSQHASTESWFQWMEISPFESGIEEIEAWIPTWALGREFEAGKDTENPPPELRLSSLMGTMASAFCATLSHYYNEIRPILMTFESFSVLDRLIQEKDAQLGIVHPIEPSPLPNFVYGFGDSLPATAPQSISREKNLKIMDAGMSNNLPIHPLLRPERHVDIIIAFDSSADIRNTRWLEMVDGYAKQRGVLGWPVQAGWPKAQKQSGDVSSASTTLVTDPPLTEDEGSLGPCTVWVGTTGERQSTEEPPPGDGPVSDFESLGVEAGMTVIYLPLIPNVNVPDVDPESSDFLSTWNFVYTQEDAENTMALARHNMEDGADKIKATVRAVYEHKKRVRLAREGGETTRPFEFLNIHQNNVL